jgi:hypothetical protein
MVISYGGGSGLGRIGGGGLKASGGEVVASHDEPLVCSSNTRTNTLFLR